MLLISFLISENFNFRLGFSISHLRVSISASHVFEFSFRIFGCNCENPWVYLVAILSNFIRVLPFFLFEFDPLLLCFWFIRMVAFGFNGLVSGFTEDGCRFCELSSADFSALGCCWFDSPLLSFLFSC